MTRLIKVNHNGQLKHGFLEIPEIIEAELIEDPQSLDKKNNVGYERTGTPSLITAS